MNAALGFVTAGAQYGLDSILIKPKRAIGPIVAQVTIEEVHHDELEITDHPVEQGASITDHAFKRPAELTIKAAWSNSPSVPGLFKGIVSGLESTVSGVQSLVSGNNSSQVRDLYTKLLKLQTDRILFDISTGKRNYVSMLVKSLSVTTDKETENSLVVTATFRQVIIVQTQVVTITAAAINQANASSTQATVESGNKQLIRSNRYVETAQ